MTHSMIYRRKPGLHHATQLAYRTPHNHGWGVPITEGHTPHCSTHPYSGHPRIISGVSRSQRGICHTTHHYTGHPRIISGVSRSMRGIYHTTHHYTGHPRIMSGVSRSMRGIYHTTHHYTGHRRIMIGVS